MQKTREILRFLIVGGGATLLDYFVMGLVLYCFNPDLQAQPTTLATVIGTGVGFVAGLIFNYIFSILFVFQESGNSRSARGALLFTLLAVGGLLIHIVGMYIGYDLWHFNEWLVKTFLTAIVLVYNYLTRKHFIFKPQNSTK